MPRSAGLATVLLLAGCHMGPDFHPPAPAMPAQWQEAKATDTRGGTKASTGPADPAWWRRLGDAELTRLEARVPAANLDLRIAAMRLVESRAQSTIAGAPLWPTLGANASYTRERISHKGIFDAFGGSPSGGGSAPQGGETSGGIPGALLRPFNLFQYGFDPSWEIDLWGGNARALESAEATEEGAEQARRATLVSVQAELARDYLQLRDAQAQIAVVQDAIAADQASLDLADARRQAGLASEIDRVQAAAELATERANLPQLESQAAQAIDQIGLLLNLRPMALEDELAPASPLPPVPAAAPIGIPSELARRRPDIRQAEAQLHAATADIGVAIADFFPKLTLSGNFGFQALRFPQLGDWSSKTYTIGPSLEIPIFQGGRLSGTLALRRAQQQEAAITYESTVQRALHEVEDALIAFRRDQERTAQLQAVVTQDRDALSLAQERYGKGLADFLPVLTAEHTLYQVEYQLADSRAAISTDYVALYKALGGGWEGA